MYLKPEYSKFCPYNGGNLYAYTDNMKYAKEFKKTRDMKKFHIKKYLVTSEELMNLTENYPPLYLNRYFYNTIDFSSDHIKMTKIPLVSTKCENIMVGNIENSILLQKVYNFAWISPSIFTNEIQKILKDIGYTTVHRVIRGIEKNEPDIRIDQLSIFIHEYGQ